jgi:hypothetical protein
VLGKRPPPAAPSLLREFKEKMQGKLKAHWRAFKASMPGRRFRDRYDRRHLITRKWFNWSQVLYIVTGCLALTLGLLMLVTPGPGGLFILLGLALLASEFLILARILDWSETKTLGPLNWIKAGLRRTTRPVRVLIAVSLLLIAAGFSYGGYLLLVKGG